MMLYDFMPAKQLKIFAHKVTAREWNFRI